MIEELLQKLGVSDEKGFHPCNEEELELLIDLNELVKRRDLATNTGYCDIEFKGGWWSIDEVDAFLSENEKEIRYNVVNR